MSWTLCYDEAWPNAARLTPETGPKGAWLITMDDDGAFRSKEFLELDVTRWMTLDVSISGMDNPSDFFKACELEFNRRNLEVSNKIMAVRVRVTGESELHHHLLSLREMREDALLANMQSAASNAVAQRIWVEKVELASRLPQSEQRYKPAAFKFLQQFIDETVLDDLWIEKYLKSPEIVKISNQVGYFCEMDVVRELEKNFDPLTVRELIGEIPEILEMKLGRNQAEELRDEEK